MAEERGRLPRRTALLRSLQVAMSAAFAVICYPVAMFLRPRRATTSGGLEIVAPFTIKDLLAGARDPFEFAGKPCLVVLTEEGRKRAAAGEALRSDDVKAFNAICTHVDCTVRFRADSRDIYCSCHNGIYDVNGQVVSGPPPRPLTPYTVSLRGEPGQEEIVISRES